MIFRKYYVQFAKATANAAILGCGDARSDRFPVDCTLSWVRWSTRSAFVFIATTIEDVYCVGACPLDSLSHVLLSTVRSWNAKHFIVFYCYFADRLGFCSLYARAIPYWAWYLWFRFEHPRVLQPLHWTLVMCSLPGHYEFVASVVLWLYNNVPCFNLGVGFLDRDCADSACRS